MAWTRIAHAEWGTPEERLEIWEDIPTDQTAPTAVTLEVVNDPQLIVGGTSGAILEPHLKSQLNFSVRDEARFLLGRFRSDKATNTPKVPGDFRVDWLQGTTLLGRYTLLFGSERPLLHRDDPVLQLKSNDGCTLLKSVPFDLVGRYTVSEMLYELLSRVGHVDPVTGDAMPVVSAFGFSHDDIKQNVPLTTAVRTSAAAWGDSDNDMYEVLIDVLRFFGMQLVQVDGEWHAIERRIRGAQYVAARQTASSTWISQTYTNSPIVLAQSQIDKLKSVERMVDAVPGVRSIFKLEERDAIRNDEFFPVAENEDPATVGTLGQLVGTVPPHWIVPAGENLYEHFDNPWKPTTTYQGVPGTFFDSGRFYVHLRNRSRSVTQVAEQTLVKGSVIEIDHSADYVFWTTDADSYNEANIRTTPQTQITLPDVIQVKLINTASGQDYWYDHETRAWLTTETWIDVKIPFPATGSIVSDPLLNTFIGNTDSGARRLVFGAPGSQANGQNVMTHVPVILPALLPESGNLQLTARGPSNPFDPLLPQGDLSEVVRFNASINLFQFNYQLRVDSGCTDVISVAPQDEADRYQVQGDPIEEEYPLGDRIDCHTWPDTIVEYLDGSDVWHAATEKWGADPTDTADNVSIHQFRADRIYAQRDRPTLSRDLVLKRDTFKKANTVFEDASNVYVPEYMQYNLRTERTRVIGNELDPRERGTSKSGGTTFPRAILPSMEASAVAQVISGVSGEYQVEVDLRNFVNTAVVEYALRVNGTDRVTGWLRTDDVFPRIITGSTTATRLAASDRDILLYLKPYAQWSGTAGQGTTGLSTYLPITLPSDGVPYVFVQEKDVVADMDGTYFCDIVYEGDVDTASVRTIYTIPGGSTEPVIMNARRGTVRVNPNNKLATGSASATIQGFSGTNAMGTAGALITVKFTVPGEFTLPDNVVTEDELVGRSFILQTAEDVVTDILFAPDETNPHNTIVWNNGTPDDPATPDDPENDPPEDEGQSEITFIGTQNTYHITSGSKNLLSTAEIPGTANGELIYAYLEVMEDVDGTPTPKADGTVLELQFTTSATTAINSANKLICILRGYTATTAIVFFVPTISSTPSFVTALNVYSYYVGAVMAEAETMTVNRTLYLGSSGVLTNLGARDDTMSDPIGDDDEPEIYRIDSSGMRFNIVGVTEGDTTARSKGIQFGGTFDSERDHARIWGTRMRDRGEDTSITFGGGKLKHVNIQGHVFFFHQDFDEGVHRDFGIGFRDLTQAVVDMAGFSGSDRLYRVGSDLYWDGSLLGGDTYTGGDGIAISAANAIAVDLATDSGLEFSSNQLQVNAGTGITVGSGGVAVTRPVPSGGTEGQVLQIASGGTTLEWGTVSTSSGTITGVTAGAGLIGGGTSGTVSLAFSPSRTALFANIFSYDDDDDNYVAVVNLNNNAATWSLVKEGTTGQVLSVASDGGFEFTTVSPGTTYTAGTGLTLTGTTLAVTRPVPSYDATNANQVLKVNGAGSAIAWAAETGGGGTTVTGSEPQEISTFTVTAGAIAAGADTDITATAIGTGSYFTLATGTDAGKIIVTNVGTYRLYGEITGSGDERTGPGFTVEGDDVRVIGHDNPYLRDTDSALTFFRYVDFVVEAANAVATLKVVNRQIISSTRSNINVNPFTVTSVDSLEIMALGGTKGDKGDTAVYTAGAGLTLTGTEFAVTNPLPLAFPAVSSDDAGKVLKINADGTAIIWDDDTDTDTTYTAGTGMTLTGTVFSVDIPVPVFSGATGGQVLKVIDTNGTLSIGWQDDTDTDTTYTAGSGMTLTGTEFSVDNPVDEPEESHHRQVLMAIDDEPDTENAGTVTMEWTPIAYSDISGTPTIPENTDTTYTAGTGLTLTGTEFSVTNPISAAEIGRIPDVGVANKVWKTDSDGNAAWRDDASGSGADGNDYVTAGSYAAGSLTLTVANQDDVVVTGFPTNTITSAERTSLGRIPTASPGANKVWKTDADGAPAWRDDAVGMPGTGEANVQSSWTETDDTSDQYIIGKPTAAIARIPTASPGAHKVWKSDADGAVAWRDDADTTYTAGTGLSLSASNEFSVDNPISAAELGRIPSASPGANKVWKSDADGAVAWRDDATGTAADGNDFVTAGTYASGTITLTVSNQNNVTVTGLPTTFADITGTLTDGQIPAGIARDTELPTAGTGITADGTAFNIDIPVPSFATAMDGQVLKVSVSGETRTIGWATDADTNTDTTYTAGDGLTLTGTTFAVGQGTGITVNANDVAVTRPVPTFAESNHRQVLMVIDSDPDTDSSGTITTEWTQVAYADISGTPSLHAVATSGSYNDLGDRPTIPVNTDTTYTAGDGLTLTGTTFAVGAGTGITVNSGDVAVTNPLPVTFSSPLFNTDRIKLLGLVNQGSELDDLSLSDLTYMELEDIFETGLPITDDVVTTEKNHFTLNLYGGRKVRVGLSTAQELPDTSTATIGQFLRFRSQFSPLYEWATPSIPGTLPQTVTGQLPNSLLAIPGVTAIARDAAVAITVTAVGASEEYFTAATGTDAGKIIIKTPGTYKFWAEIDILLANDRTGPGVDITGTGVEILGYDNPYLRDVDAGSSYDGIWISRYVDFSVSTANTVVTLRVVHREVIDGSVQNTQNNFTVETNGLRNLRIMPIGGTQGAAATGVSLPAYTSANDGQVLGVSSGTLAWVAGGGGGGTTYTAGSGITIENGVITADVHTEGTGININNGVISADVVAGNGMSRSVSNGQITFSVGAGTGLTRSTTGLSVTRAITSYGTQGQLLAMAAGNNSVEWVNPPTGTVPALGTAGQVLTVNSGATASVWADAASGVPDVPTRDFNNDVIRFFTARSSTSDLMDGFDSPEWAGIGDLFDTDPLSGHFVVRHSRNDLGDIRGKIYLHDTQILPFYDSANNDQVLGVSNGSLSWTNAASGATRLLTNHDLTNGSVELTDDIANYEYFDVVVQHSNGQQYTIRLKRDQLEPYAAVSRTISGLYTIDGQTLYSLIASNGEASAVLKLSGDPIHANSSYRAQSGLAFGDGAFWLYAIPSGETTGHIFKINAANGAVTEIVDTGFGSGDSIGLEYAGSTLYLYRGSTTGGSLGRLYSVHQTSGATTLLGTASVEVLGGIGLAYTGSTMYLIANKDASVFGVTIRKVVRWTVNLSNGGLSNETESTHNSFHNIQVGAAYFNSRTYVITQLGQDTHRWQLAYLALGTGSDLERMGTNDLPFEHGIGGLAAGSATVQANAETDLSRFVRYDPANSGRQLAVFTDMDNTDHLYIYAGTGSDAPESISIYGVANI